MSLIDKLFRIIGYVKSSENLIKVDTLNNIRSDYTSRCVVYPQNRNMLKKHLGSTIAVTGVLSMIDTNKGTALIRSVKLNKTKLTNHIWVKYCTEKPVRLGEIVIVTGEVVKYYKAKSPSLEAVTIDPKTIMYKYTKKEEYV